MYTCCLRSNSKTLPASVDSNQLQQDSSMMSLSSSSTSHKPETKGSKKGAACSKKKGGEPRPVVGSSNDGPPSLASTTLLSTVLSCRSTRCMGASGAATKSARSTPVNKSSKAPKKAPITSLSSTKQKDEEQKMAHAVLASKGNNQTLELLWKKIPSGGTPKNKKKKAVSSTGSETATAEPKEKKKAPPPILVDLTRDEVIEDTEMGMLNLENVIVVCNHNEEDEEEMMEEDVTSCLTGDDTWSFQHMLCLFEPPSRPVARLTAIFWRSMLKPRSIG